jgi:uncharacterized protein (DUF58 family)
MLSLFKNQQASREPGTTTDIAANSRIHVSTAELIGLRHAAQSLNLHASRIRSLHGQNYLSPFKGRGMEFDEARPYQPGDDIRSLDWKVTARSGKPHTKLFREERERPVIVAVDFRPAMFFATQGVFKSVIAAKCAALLAWCATRQGDRLGGFIFSDKEHREWRPTLRAAATLHFLEQLAERGSPKRDGNDHVANPDTFINAMARLRRVTRPGSLIALLSDFRDLDASSEAHLAQLARHNELMLIFIYEPLETSLPPAGQYRVAGSGREILLDTRDESARKEYAQRFSDRRARVERLCKRHRMVFLSCATTDDPLERLQQGLILRQP